MKKIIAIAMALVMMMAICVPAFAANPIVKDGEQTGSADVYTTFDENTDWSYTVTIPAGVQVDWDDTAPQDMIYTVESQLLIGASLKVSAAADNEGKMTNPNAAEDQFLTFTVAGGDVVTFAEVNAANTTAPGVVDGTNVTVAVAGFDNVPVGTYTGTMTYTVEYVAPVTA